MLNTADLHTLLVNTLKFTAPAECHGAITGLACAHQPGQAVNWSGAVSIAESDKANKILWALGEETARDLNGDDISFAPVLPGDNENIGIRASALQLWCRGFLYGFGVTAADTVGSNLPDEASEVVRDFAEIAREPMATEGGEADEAAYAEIVEYIRISVQLVFETLQPETKQPNPTLH